VKRKQVLLLTFLALLASLVVWIALRNRQPPFLPADTIHRSATGPEVCLTCHDTGGMMPRSKNHPVGNDCYRCHAARRD
jgi:hypothetical protein